MILENKKISCEDVKAYWLSLFREFDSMEKLETLLKDMSDIDLGKAEEFIRNYDEEAKIEVDELLALEDSELLKALDSELQDTVPFYYFHRPIINLYIDKFYNQIKTLEILEDRDLFLKNITELVATGLFEFSQRTLILEINIARMRKDLKGESKEERYDYFVYTLLNNKNYLSQLYKEYFHLYNVMINRAEIAFDFILDMLKETDKNLSRIKEEILNTKEDIKIQHIESSLGDSHNNGKTVSIIKFSNGEKVVFKPRILGLEEGFNKFLTWINENHIESHEKLYIMKIINGEKYGWTEFISYDQCNDTEEVKDFYFNIGRLLGILYSLNAKDIHHENIIAMGKHPVIIDLEALFHSSVVLMEQEFFCSHEVAYEIIDSSVYSIGFLPQKISGISDETELTVDVSGLSAVEDQVSPFKFLQLKNFHTDELKLEEGYGVITVQNNNPKINGKLQKSEDYLDYIRQGFISIYKFMLENKNEVIEVVKNTFKGKKNRFILRPTYLYGQLIKTSHHPDFFRDKIHREILLHRLGINIEKKFKKIVSSEIHDILMGDVPYFYSYIDSNRIHNSMDEDINLELDKSPMDKVLSKISHFSNKDMNMQLNFIDMSFIAKNTNSNKDLTPIKFSENTEAVDLPKQRYLELAQTIGDYILERSIVGESKEGKDRTWISTVLEGREEGTWSLSPVGDNLYDGNVGIALFLGQLGSLVLDYKYINTSMEAMESSIKTIKRLDGSIPYLTGPFNGATGCFYALSKFYKNTRDKRALDVIKENISILYKLIDGDKSLDVIGGAAGAIGVLLSIYKDTQDEDLKDTVLDLAMANYKHLKKNAVEYFGDSVAWGSGGIYVPSTGFAHGNAGIAAYLGKLWSITKDEEIKDLIVKALNYERHLYLPQQKNWRSSHTKDRAALAWCHGAPGILLSRLILKEAGYQDDYIDEEIENAMDTTINKCFGNNPCYCHGDIGNLSILQYAAKVLKDENLKNRCENTFNEMFELLIKPRWNKGVYCGTEAMGLMIGLAGFGYALINKYDENLVPPVLWFE